MATKPINRFTVQEARNLRVYEYYSATTITLTDADASGSGDGAITGTITAVSRSGATATYTTDGTARATTASSTSANLLDPRQIETYEIMTSRDQSYDNVSLDTAGNCWRSALIANRRAWIAAPTMQDELGNTVTKGDTMIKSNVNQFDSFTLDNRVDVAIRDGEDIVAIAEFGDRILQFKHQTLYIKNISQDFEFLEATYDGYGVDSSKQVCKIGEGLAWVNATGVYYFNGQGVESLSDEKMLSATFNPSGISYYGAEKLLLVWYNGSDLLSYSLKSKNWSSESLSVDQPNTTSIYYNNTPYWFDSSDALVKASLGSTSSASTIETGDISCGDLSRRKSFHKLYVTVKNGTEFQLDYQIDADGSWSTPADFPNDNGINEFKLSAKGKTIRFRISTNGAADTNMEVSDLSLIYRNKSIK